MKKILFLGLGVFMLVGAKAQQLTFNSQYMLNSYLINPAAAGVDNELSIASSFRQQWAGFKDAPKTQMLSGNAQIKDNMGVGVIIYNDVTGPLRNVGFQGSYSYHIKTGDKSKLALGLSLMATQHVLDGSNFILNDEVDNTLNGAKLKSFNPDATFGMHYFGDNYYVGISIPQLIENKYKFGDDISAANKEVRHYYMTGGYTFKVNEYLSIQPSMLLKFVPNTPFQFDINARAFYKENVWAGVSYRDKESVVAMLGIKRDKFVLGYSYDYTLSTIKNYSAGTHELYLEFQIPTAKKRHAASLQ